MRFRIGSMSILLLAGTAASAQDAIQRQPVQFARSTSSQTIRASIRGYRTIDYVVGARAGQNMSVSLRTTNRSNFFNVLPPRGETAIFTGSSSGNRFSARPTQSGDYRVRV